MFEFLRRRKKVLAFDFWVTLTERPKIRAIARRAFRAGHEVHIVSAISPGLPLDNDAAYAMMLANLGVPFTAIHRTDHVAAEKVRVLRNIRCDEFWDDDTKYLEAARDAGFVVHKV